MVALGFIIAFPAGIFSPPWLGGLLHCVKSSPLCHVAALQCISSPKGQKIPVITKNLLLPVIISDQGNP